MRLEERSVLVVKHEVAPNKNNEFQEGAGKLDGSIDESNTCNNKVEALRKVNNDDDIEKFTSDNHEEHSSFLTKPAVQSSGKSNNGLYMLYQNFKNLRKQILISCCVYISFLLDGYSVGWSAPVIVKLQNSTQTPLAYIISDTTASWLASVIFLGVIGSNLAGFLSNIIGRKPSLMIGGIILICSNLILTFSTTISMMYFGRFVNGLGLSFSTLVGLIYIAEISSPIIRGTLLTLTGVFHNIGALLLYCVGPFTSYQELNYLTLALSPVFILTCFYIPESPIYYILKGFDEAAISCLNYLNRSNDIDIELKKIICNMQQKESKRVLWRQLLLKKSNRRALFITVTMYFLQMNSGIIFFVFFATKIFKDAGSSIEPYVATIVVGITSLLGSLIVPIFIERFGRRRLLILSAGGCSICMTVMGVYFYLDKYYRSSVIEFGWLPLLTMIAAFIFYGVGLNNIPHTLNGEMYSTNVRSLGSSISFFASWMFGLISTTVSSYLMVYLGSHFVFWLFAAVNATALIFVVLFVPETTGKTLTEIDEMMAD